MTIATSELTIDSDHIYRVGGRILPSVTQIINAVIPMRFKPDDWYLVRGSALHAAIDLHVRGELDIDSIDPAYRGKFDAFLKFMGETNAFIEESEVMLYSKRYGFSGTFDAFIKHKPALSQYAICDWKGSISPTVDLQLGGYSILHREKRNLSLPLPQCGVGVQLNDDGSYACRWVKDLKRSEQAFLSVLSVYNWMKKENMIQKLQEETNGN